MFYKYYDISGIIKTLGGGAIKLSNPRTFNDPWDMYYSMDRTEADLHVKALEKDATNFITKNMPLGVFKKEQEKKFEKHRLSYEKGSAEYKNFIDSDIEKLKKSEEYKQKIEKINLEFENTINEELSTFRVFCMSEVIDDPLMWSHYAQQHYGAALGFKPIDKKSYFNSVKKVKYLEDRPHAFSLQEEITEEKKKQIYEALLYTKSHDWKYEKEFRLIIPFIPETDVVPISRLSIYEPDLDSLYLGLRILDVDANTVIKLARILNPKVKIFKAFQVHGRYELKFESLDL